MENGKDLRGFIPSCLAVSIADNADEWMAQIKLSEYLIYLCHLRHL
jgi:hypothetical protein